MNKMSDSDIEIRKIAPMKPVKKPPKSPTETILKSREKKVTTKLMIHEALNDLKTRKGVSSYAIKKYLETRYNVETEKINYLIKKTLKTGVEEGSIIQLKGIGASGSFKLAPIKERPKKKPKAKKEKTIAKPTKEKMAKEKIVKEKAIGKTEKGAKKIVKKITIEKEVKKQVKKAEKPKTEKVAKVKLVKEKAVKQKAMATPSKKKALMKKRKSIGSIIKPPKMKPKSKA